MRVTTRLVPRLLYSSRATLCPAIDGMYSTFPDPLQINEFFLRGSEERLIDLCPKFRGSNTPVLFHLPERTIERLLESLSPIMIGPVFVENCRSRFGLDREIVKKQLPRWICSTDVHKASKFSSGLAGLITKRPQYIPLCYLTDVVYVAGYLAETGTISGELAAEVIKVVFPLCLDKLQLSRADIYKMLYGVNRVQISPSDAHVYPLIANFTMWYLDRSRLNRLRRNRQKAVAEAGNELIGQ